MASTATRPAAATVSAAWRSLGRMDTYQVPIVLGGALATVAGVLTYALAIARRAAFVAPSMDAIWLFGLGILGLIGYGVTRSNVRNGVVVAALAGFGLLVLAGDVGLWTGLAVLAGAIWGFTRHA